MQSFHKVWIIGAKFPDAHNYESFAKTPNYPKSMLKVNLFSQILNSFSNQDKNPLFAISTCFYILEISFDSSLQLTFFGYKSKVFF